MLRSPPQPARLSLATMAAVLAVLWAHPGPARAAETVDELEPGAPSVAPEEPPEAIAPPPPTVPPAASRYANLSPTQCIAELKRRAIPVERVTRRAAGVATPLRLKGKLHDVSFRLPGANSVHGITDCRLLLTLDDLAQIFHRYSVVEVRVDNTYRPRSKIAGRRVRSQHSYALAIDLVSMKLEDGTELRVDRDWKGTIGVAACGPGSEPPEPTAETMILRTLICEIAYRGVFHHILTPNYNRAHRTHIHADIKRDATRIIVR